MTALFCCSYRAYSPDMGQAVVTSLGLPKYRPESAGWPRNFLIAPSSALFKLHGPEFRGPYIERLERFGVQRIAKTLEAIAQQHEAESLVLLCHEVNWDNCHRKVFAEWLMTRTGELIQEVEVVMPRQLTLPTM